MARYLLILLMVVGLAGGALGYVVWQNGVSRLDPAAGIPTYEVTRGSLERTVVSIGQLQASRSATLTAPFEARITRLLDEGTRVEEGDPVIWLETDDIEDQLEDALSQLELDKKNLQAAIDSYELEQIRNQYTLETERTRVEIARQEYEDARQKHEAEQVLFERNVTPANRLDEARLTLLQRELGLRNAQIELAKVEENLEANLRVRQRAIETEELRVQNSERKVREAQERIDSAILTAPVPGEISYLRIWRQGQVSRVNEGDTVWRRSNLIEIPDTSEMLVSFPVNEIDTARIQPGQLAEVRLMARQDMVFSGKVLNKSVAPITDSARLSWTTGGQDSPGPREFEVRVRLDEPNPMFRQGMTAAVRVIVDEVEDALLVPLDAIFERDGRKGVFVRDGLAANFRPVDIRLSGENLAAIEGDVRPGQRVLLTHPGSDDGPALPAVAQEVEEFEEDDIGDPAAAAPSRPRAPGGAS